MGNLLLLLTRLLLIFIYIQFWLPGYGRSGDLLSGISAIAAAATYLVGTFLLTLNEHPFLRSPDRRSAVLQRIGATILFLCVAAGVYHQGYLPSGGPWYIAILQPWLVFSGNGYWHFATLVLLLIAWLIYCICTILEYRFLGKLAGRLLDRFMTEHCIIAGIGAGLSNLLALLIVRDFVSYTFIHSRPLVLWSTFAVIIAWILFQIWTGFMNIYCARRFIEQAWLAEEHWKARQADPQIVQR